MDSLFSFEASRLARTFDAETLWIEAWGENGLRVRATQHAVMPEADWALLPDEPRSAEVSIEGDAASITNGKITARVEAEGRISFYNQDGRLLLREYSRFWTSATSPSALKVGAREFYGQRGGDFSLAARFESDPGEKLFGMGQYQQACMDLKGCCLELAHRNSQASVPFCLSSLGYGLLWNNPAIGKVFFGKNLTEWQAASTKALDYWIVAGDSPAEIEEAYAQATGKAPLMPDYGLGFWQCKLRYQTQEELLEVAREYKRRGLPVSVIVIDFFHWAKQGDWSFDPEYWPDPEAMISELKGMGIELMVSIWPTVDITCDNFQEMLRKGYLVRVERGVRTTMQFCGDTLFYDPTNPGARDYLWRVAKANYYDKGVRLFWLDEAEPDYTAFDYDNYRYSMGSDLQVGNLYPAMYAKTFYDGMVAAGQENPVNLLRCAWAGSQRYGALVWSGDVHSDFATLRNQLRIGLNMGIAGIPWWTSDIGGFFGGDVREDSFKELLLRWFEFGAFCPVFRLHGDREPHSKPLGRTGGGIFHSGAANEAWSYGEQAYRVMAGYIRLRERLRPYLAGLMKEAHERGSPVMRPLFYGFPKDAAAWDIEDEYLLGPDLLVAPVLHEGARSRELYLPSGARWLDADSGEGLGGGCRITRDAPLDAIPLFVREGGALEPSLFRMER